MLAGFLVILGLLLLFFGGEYLVRGSVAVARQLGMSPLVIGVTLVGFGTSAPELMASIQAALSGAPGIAVGNVIGSNICNILLILGVGAVILPFHTPRGALMRDGGVMLGGAFLLTMIVVLMDEIGFWVGLTGFSLLIVYAYWTYWADANSNEPVDLPEEVADAPVDKPLWYNFATAIGGIAGVVLGAMFLVDGSVDIARSFGVSDAVIGITLVAIGTSLPELAATIAASIKKHNELAFGNVLGSSTFNTLGILGVTAMVTPLPIPPEIITFSIWAMLGAMVLLAALSLARGQLGRMEGIGFVAAYVIFIALTVAPGGDPMLGAANVAG